MLHVGEEVGKGENYKRRQEYDTYEYDTYSLDEGQNKNHSCALFAIHATIT